jgi:DNA-binding transcriptional MerR regulator
MASEPLTDVELARVVGMTAKDVRFYQERGLLQRPRRHPGWKGEVAYHQEHVDRVKLISRALILGFSPSAIGQLVNAGRLNTCRDIYEISAAQLDRITCLLGPNAPSAAALKELIATCPKTGTREDCPIYSVLSNGRTISASVHVAMQKDVVRMKQGRKCAS